MTLPRRAVLALPSVGLAVPASAHALVVGSVPAAGERLRGAPPEAVVRFNSRLDHARSQLLLAPVREAAGATAGAERLELIEPSPETELRARLPSLAPGSWRLRWQVLALDGHITRGDIVFEVVG